MFLALSAKEKSDLMNIFKGSWKTTVLGWAGLIGAFVAAVVAFLSDGPGGVDFEGLWSSLIVVFPSLAAIFASDDSNS